MRRLLFLLAACAVTTSHATNAALFYWFEYTGRDPAYTQPAPKGSFHNPILAGYYPDPSITRAGDQYYLVNSTFAHWPGIPIHESSDLVHWKLVGHALSDRTKVSFDGLNTSRGVFAPSIHFHDGTFYVINTLVDAGGNFFVTAKNPAGPWSDPVWLKEIDGIDPSFFFDIDGKTYILNNGGPEGTPLYNGHRAIWIQQFDLSANKLIGPRKVIVNGGVDITKKPIWTEGPHLYRVGEWYYLSCAEGGTGPGHSQVVLRAKSPWGPYEPFAGNPILTQRDLPANRPNAVTNAGHADLIEMKDGSWWAVFLASRPYRDDLYNTGRETFLLPVTWKDGWPTILEPRASIPLTLRGPGAMSEASARGADLLSGNFTKRDDFRQKLGPEWITVHVPDHEVPQPNDRGLFLPAGRNSTLADKRNAGFLARRQQHLNFDASTEISSNLVKVEAGLAAFQNETHWYFLGVRGTSRNNEIFLQRASGASAVTVATARVSAPKKHRIQLRISGNGPNYSFYYDAGQGWKPLVENDDATFLSTEKAGGFVGTVIGPYAQTEKP